MRDRTVDRLFERFRTQGDVRALGDVFDATSEELLRVATSLMRDLPEAEDLLQATFVTAIERARHWDREQRLVPWLCGILVRHAHAKRRDRARVVDPTRLERVPDRSPSAAACDAEFARELERALGSLASDDREVLIAYLREGKEPIEIARERGLAPGTARMRVHRGLERLRKALPAGFALGATGMLAGRGLAAVRGEIVREASAAAAKLAAGVSISSTVSIGGILVTKKLVLALSVLLAVLAVYWFRASVHDEGGTEDPGASVARVEPAGSAAPAEPVAPVAESGSPERAVVDARGIETDAAGDASALVGVRGRVLDAHGAPAAGVEVALLELESSEWMPSIDAAPFLGARPPKLELGRTTTDEAGRFTIGGARAQALNMVGFNLGGAGAALHLVHAAFEPGETRDLGDFVLAPLCAVTGRVVDDEGRPLAGVRVRAGEVAAELRDFGLESLRADSLLVLHGKPRSAAFEVPPWLAPYLERLPIATTRTAPDGTFVLPGVAVGRATLFCDAPGRVAVRVEGLELEADHQRDVGDVVLSLGATARVRVVDATGAPVERADVRVGTLHAAELETGCFERARELGEGEYESTGLAPGEAVHAAVRRDPRAPWTIVAGDATGGALAVTLPAERMCAFAVTDELRIALESARILAWPADPAAESPFAWLLRAPSPLATRTDARGRAELELADGAYDVCVVTASGETLARTVQVDAAHAQHEFVVARGRELVLTVVDGASGAPIPRAVVVLGTQSSPAGGALGRLETDARGVARFRGLPPPVEGTPWSVRVDHPRHGQSFYLVEAARTEHELRVPPAGALVARLAPEFAEANGLVLELTLRTGHHVAGAQEGAPRLAGFGDAPELRCAALASGDYSYRLLAGFPSEIGALTLARVEVQPTVLARGSVTISPGGETELVLEPAPSAASARPSGGATVTGTVRVDGRPGAQLRVDAHLQDRSTRHAWTDSTGRFEIADLTGNGAALLVSRDNGARPIGMKVVEFAPGATVDVTIDWKPKDVLVRVVDDASGAPVTRATLHYTARDNSAAGTCTTDARGRATFSVVPPCSVFLLASSPEAGTARQVVDVAERGAPAEFELRLVRPVECRGRVRIPEAFRRASTIQLRVEDANHVVCVFETFEPRGDSSAEFGFNGLAPGVYELSGNADGQGFAPLPFELTAAGATDLDFELRPLR